jgi:hypothetical protein
MSKYLDVSLVDADVDISREAAALSALRKRQAETAAILAPAKWFAEQPLSQADQPGSAKMTGKPKLHDHTITLAKPKRANLETT